MPEHSKPSELVEVDLSGARTARIWANVSLRLQPRPSKRWALGVGVAAAVAVLLLLSLRPGDTKPEAPALAARTTLQAAQQGRRVVMSDGSQVNLSPRTEVFVAKHELQAFELDLKEGAVLCDVKPTSGRRFVIRAGQVKVVVVGTRFNVSNRMNRTTREVSVQVERGVVEVHSDGRVHRLTAGKRWASWQPSVDQAAARVSSRPQEPSAESIEPSPALPNPSAAAEPSRARARLPNPSPSADGAADGPATADARKLLELGNRARRNGDMRAAAGAYEALLQHYPRDGRAGLAAFELGRLRMDHLGDTAGAISALSHAARAAGGSVREDAMARLVRAYAARGAQESCRRARQNYERSYPEGLHRAEIRTFCGPR
jgi:TolA-binding protein